MSQAQPADRAGNFRADIIEYDLYEAESGAVAVTLKAKLLELWGDGEWHPWAEYEMEASGNSWIVKKDGKLNDKSVESLMRYAGWNGDIESIVNKTWKPTPCQVVLNAETYKNVTEYKIAFINDYNSTPGMTGNVSPDKAKQLAGKHGSQLRALFSTLKRNAPAPSGDRPAAPPGKLPGVDPAKQRNANKELAAAGSKSGEDDTPF